MFVCTVHKLPIKDCGRTADCIVGHVWEREYITREDIEKHLEILKQSEKLEIDAKNTIKVFK